VSIAALPAAILAWVAPVTALAFGLLAVALALFFRDPERHPPRGTDVVVAPADGRVMFAGPASPEQSPGADRWLQVTIFLSVFDVHINRAPTSGRVMRVDHVPGGKRAAFRHDAHRNAHSEVWVDHGGTMVVFRQVVGLLARRIVCRLSAGDEVATGARIGLMKFGSRMDVFLPAGSRLVVVRGDRVRAGETVIAHLAGEREGRP